MENLKLCCLMAVYKKDNENWLVEAIESIVKQTKIPDEFLIVGDGELSDSLNQIIDKCVKIYPFIRFITYKENKGLWYALNYGVNNTDCELIARMDSDDIARTDRFEIEYNMFLKDSKLCMVGSNTIEFKDDISNFVSKREMPQTNSDIKKFIGKRNPFIHSSVMFKRDAVLKAGNYRNAYLCEDYDLWARMYLDGAEFYNIQENLVFMRVDDNFYKRRGGLKYVKSILKLKRFLFKNRISSLGSFLLSSIATLVIGLMPNSFRTYFYRKFLRK